MPPQVGPVSKQDIPNQPTISQDTMPDPFAHLVPDARAFLSELAAHNSRDWFTENKARYESTLKAPALLMLDQVAHDLGRQSGQVLKPKLFRPHRDVRFSKDKTPYHTHLHMLWVIESGAGQNPGLFLGIAPDYVRIGGGIMGFEKEMLICWRTAVDGALGDGVQRLLDGLATKGLMPDEPELKRVPAPYEKAHPNAGLLRRKSLTVWRDLAPDQHKAPQAAMADLFKSLRPLFQRLRLTTR